MSKTHNEKKLLIAKFMGYHYRENFHGRSAFWHSADSSEWGKGTWTPAFGIEDIEYHNSWDWTFPVLEKIQKMGYPYLISHCTVSIYKVWQEQFIAHAHGEDTILAAVECIVEFIEAYNNQNL